MDAALAAEVLIDERPVIAGAAPGDANGDRSDRVADLLAAIGNGGMRQPALGPAAGDAGESSSIDADGVPWILTPLANMSGRSDNIS